MIDIFQAILTGLFTGLGVGIANYITEREIKKRLDFIYSKIAKVEVKP